MLQFCSVSNSLSHTTRSIKWEVYFSKELCRSSLLRRYDSACICICVCIVGHGYTTGVRDKSILVRSKTGASLLDVVKCHTQEILIFIYFFFFLVKSGKSFSTVCNQAINSSSKRLILKLFKEIILTFSPIANNPKVSLRDHQSSTYDEPTKEHNGGSCRWCPIPANKTDKELLMEE